MRPTTLRLMALAAGVVLIVGLGIAGLTLMTRGPATGDPTASTPAKGDQVADASSRERTAPGDPADDARAKAIEADQAAADQVAQIIEGLRAAKTNAVQPAPDDQVGAQVLEERLAEIGIKRPDIRLLARKCAPAPCVTAVELVQTTEGGEEGRQEIFLAAMEAAESEDAQPTISWTETDDSSVGYIWFVPNELSPAASEALLSAALEHKSQLGG